MERKYEFTRPEAPVSSADAEHRQKGTDHVRGERSGLKVPAHRAIETTQRCSQCPDCPYRRLRLRRDQRLWRALSDADRGKTRSGRVGVHPLSHYRAVLAHAPGLVDRSQPPFRGHGRHHRDCHGRAGLLLGAPQLDVAAREDAETQRLFHGAIWQVPRSAGVGDESGGPV